MVTWYRMRGNARVWAFWAWAYLRLCDVVGIDRATRIWVALMERQVVARREGDSR